MDFNVKNRKAFYDMRNRTEKNAPQVCGAPDRTVCLFIHLYQNGQPYG